jgi:hypothetical protein
MIDSIFAARVTISAASLSLVTLAALHVLKSDLGPGQTMISRYALGRHGWVMAVCFAAFGAASGSLFAALLPHVAAPAGRIGLVFLLTAAVGLVMAARFPMDPVGTPQAAMSRSGRMHGIAFLLGVPSMVLAVLLLSVSLGDQSLYTSSPLMAIAMVIWLSLVVMIAIMVMVGPGAPSDPNGPERFVGWPNRLLMVGYAVWLIIAAWPMARG